MATDGKSKGCNDRGALLAQEELTEGKLAAVFAPLSLRLSFLLQVTFTQRDLSDVC